MASYFHNRTCLHGRQLTEGLRVDIMVASSNRVAHALKSRMALSVAQGVGGHFRAKSYRAHQHIRGVDRLGTLMQLKVQTKKLTSLDLFAWGQLGGARALMGAVAGRLRAVRSAAILAPRPPVAPPALRRTAPSGLAPRGPVIAAIDASAVS